MQLNKKIRGWRVSTVLLTPELGYETMVFDEYHKEVDVYTKRHNNLREAKNYFYNTCFAITEIRPATLPLKWIALGILVLNYCVGCELLVMYVELTNYPRSECKNMHLRQAIYIFGAQPETPLFDAIVESSEQFVVSKYQVSLASWPREASLKLRRLSANGSLSVFWINSDIRNIRLQHRIMLDGCTICKGLDMKEMFGVDIRDAIVEYEQAIKNHKETEKEVKLKRKAIETLFQLDDIGWFGDGRITGFY